jgi:D-serine deaminase-like pyridoxal phosphate-dependent protein
MGLSGFASGVDLPVSLVRMSEEHGVLQIPASLDLPIGSRIALRPIHVCTTVNLSDLLYFSSASDGIVPVAVAARGKRV